LVLVRGLFGARERRPIRRQGIESRPGASAASIGQNACENKTEKDPASVKNATTYKPMMQTGVRLPEILRDYRGAVR
jgi:hypothetical protein